MTEVPKLDGAIEPPVACTLDRDAAMARLAEWNALLSSVTARERIPDGLRLRFGAGASVDTIERLAIAEHACCSFMTFAVAVVEPDRTVTLEVSAPAEAQSVVAELFGAADPSE